MGRMGAGKSTILKICAGLVRADTGWIQFLGEQYFRPRLFQLAPRGLFYLPERDGLVVGLTVSAHFKALRRRFGVTDCNEIIELLKLETVMDSKLETLSGGEERRVSMAMAMLRKPQCLIADELFRSVDPVLAELLGSCLRRMASMGCAILVTGHELRLLSPYLDSVVWVTAGTTYSLGAADTAWKDERFRREYLGETR